jgi:hypothetical protein
MLINQNRPKLKHLHTVGQTSKGKKANKFVYEATFFLFATFIEIELF